MYTLIFLFLSLEGQEARFSVGCVFSFLEREKREREAQEGGRGGGRATAPPWRQMLSRSFSAWRRSWKRLRVSSAASLSSFLLFSFVSLTFFGSDGKIGDVRLLASPSSLRYRLRWLLDGHCVTLLARGAGSRMF